VLDDGVNSASSLVDGVVALGVGRNIEIFDVSHSLRFVRRLVGHANAVKCLVLCGGGALFSGSFDGAVKRWDWEKGGKEVWSRAFGGGPVWCLAELPSGSVVSGSNYGTLRIHDAATGAEVAVLRGAHAKRVVGVVGFGPSHVLSASNDWTIRVWTVGGGVQSVVDAGVAIESFALTPCGQMAAVGCFDGTVRAFCLEWELLWSQRKHRTSVLAVAFLSMRRFLASGSGDGTVVVSAVCTGEAVFSTSVNSPVTSLVPLPFSGGGSWLWGAADGSVGISRIFESRRRAIVSLFQAEAGGIRDDDWFMGEVLREIVGRCWG
jgi:WD40 repeat protein